MNSSRRSALVAWVLLGVCFAGSVVNLRRLDRVRERATLQDVLFISSPKALKRLSLGYEGLLADIYWTRAVQYFGSHLDRRTTDFTLLAPLLKITTALDPHLIVAYQFGGNFLSPEPPMGAGRPEAAVDLIEFGIKNNPENWKLYYELGFVYYMDMKDYGKAADAFLRGTKVPNAHPFLKILAANMAQHAGDTQMARALWITTYESTTEKKIRGNAVAHLRALEIADDVIWLEDLAIQYQVRTGQFPRNTRDLVMAGMLPGIPVDPTGRPYKITPIGTVEVQVPDDFPFIEKGAPPGYIPPHPKNLEALGGDNRPEVLR
jgi:hypothetical protein